jgi:hypothetical protein
VRTRNAWRRPSWKKGGVEKSLCVPIEWPLHGVRDRPDRHKVKEQKAGTQLEFNRTCSAFDLEMKTNRLIPLWADV